MSELINDWCGSCRCLRMTQGECRAYGLVSDCPGDDKTIKTIEVDPTYAAKLTEALRCTCLQIWHDQGCPREKENDYK